MRVTKGLVCPICGGRAERSWSTTLNLWTTRVGHAAPLPQHKSLNARAERGNCLTSLHVSKHVSFHANDDPNSANFCSASATSGNSVDLPDRTRLRGQCRLLGLVLLR